MNKSPWLMLTAAIAIALLGAAPARAAVLYTYSIQSVSAASPSTGDEFEVDLTNNSGSPIVVNSFTFGIQMPTGFTITAANCTTAVNTYIFSPTGTDSLACPDLSTPGTLPGTSVDASDVWVGAGNGATVADGATVALGEIIFDAASGLTPGPYTVSFIPADDSMSDVTGAPIGPINDSGTGTITVPAASVPEPSTMALFGLTLLPLVWAKKRSRS
jgi:hypothetical protein